MLVASQRIRVKRLFVHSLRQLFQIGDIDPVFADLHLFSEGIGAQVAAVDIQADRNHIRGNVHPQRARKGVGELIAQQGCIGRVGQQAPLFRLAHAKKVRLFIQLDVIGLFRGTPGGIASALDVIQRAVVQNRSVFIQHADRARLSIFLVGMDRVQRAGFGVDIDRAGLRSVQHMNRILLCAARQNGSAAGKRISDFAADELILAAKHIGVGGEPYAQRSLVIGRRQKQIIAPVLCAVKPVDRANRGLVLRRRLADAQRGDPRALRRSSETAQACTQRKQEHHAKQFLPRSFHSVSFPTQNKNALSQMFHRKGDTDAHGSFPVPRRSSMLLSIPSTICFSSAFIPIIHSSST